MRYTETTTSINDSYVPNRSLPEPGSRIRSEQLVGTPNNLANKGIEIQY
jgi:hypothetical protein